MNYSIHYIENRNLDTNNYCVSNQYRFCIGYTHSESVARCELMWSNETDSCPMEYTGYVGPTVTSTDELAGSPNNFFSGCYGKFTGRNNI